MREPHLDEVLAALKDRGAQELAAAIYAENDIDFVERLTDALVDASTRLATYPHDRVVYEADALLYDTLRDPIADAVAGGPATADPAVLARNRDITLEQATATLARLAATDADAAHRLLASGVDPNWTLAQQQVTTCIRELLDAGVTPTRATVVAHAIEHAGAALRPGDSAPFAIPADPSLPTRILSTSPMAAVPGWMTRMDADPPTLGIAEDRIAYLRAAKSAAGRANTAANRLSRVPAPSVCPQQKPRPTLTLA